MRLSVLLIFIGTIGLHATSSYSQETKINLNIKDVTLSELLTEIGKKYEFSFWYSSKVIETDKKISLQAKDLTIDKVLKQALTNCDLNYTIKDKVIFIYQESDILDKIPFSQSAQKFKITGVVLDAVSGDPLPGVNILIEGTTNGVVADPEGKFIIEVPSSSAVLVFSFVGYNNERIELKGQTELKISLIPDIKNLDEVIVVGYGTVKKSDLTGAVAVVKSDVLEKIAVSTAAESLQGRIAGVSITSKGAAPGSDMDIKIRGIGSFGGNEPLIIIDGVPASRIDYLNPGDIASVNVLKDAASAAIYGSRAGNGVILIETKKGKAGVPTISFSSTLGSEEVTNLMDMANAEQYKAINTLVNQNGIQDGTVTQMPPWLNSNFAKKTGDTDWQDAIFRPGFRQNYNIAVRGGTENATYSLSGGLFDHKGAVLGSSYKKYNARLNSEIKKGRLKLIPVIAFSDNIYDLNDYDPETHGANNTFVELRKMSPLIPVYDPDRPSGYGYIEELRGENPVGEENLKTKERKRTELITNLNMEFELLKGLKIKLQSGLRNFWEYNLSHHPSYQIDMIAEKYPELSEENYKLTITNIEPMISFDKELGNHNINAVFGTTYYKFRDRNAFVYALGENPHPDIEERGGFQDDENFKTLDAAGGGTFSGSGTEHVRTEFSYFGRINYTLLGRYILQTTLRQDYSSRFGKETGGGLFPSLALGWNVDKESFFKPATSFINTLKFRASYGQTGSQADLGAYDYAALITTTGYGYPVGINQSLRPTRYASSLENRNLKWENTESINLGLDYGLFNSKLNGAINYYISQRSDMLLSKPVPLSAGLLNEPIVNIGEMKNWGWEFELSYRTKLAGIRLQTTGTFTTQGNEVLKLSYKNEEAWGSVIGYDEAVTRTKEGDAVASFFVYQMDGIFQNQADIDAYNSKAKSPGSLLPKAKPGDVRFKDINNDGILDEKDKINGGNGLPKYLYSLDLNLEYKGFDLSMFFQGAGNYKIYNTTRYYGEHMKDNFNYFATLVNAWTPQNPSKTIPRPVFSDPNQNSRPSTRFLENGDYLRLKNIQLGYNLPKSVLGKIKVDRCRVFISAQNLFTVTKYSGYDPELVERRYVWDTGIDFGEFPMTKLYNIGIQLDF